MTNNTTQKIDNAWIRFANRDTLLSPVSFSSILDDNENFKYGMLNINVKPTPITDKKLLYEFIVDESGSMSEQAKTTVKFGYANYMEHRTKMELIKETIINMLIYFAKISKSIYITVTGFDNRIRKYIECPTLVTTETLDKLIQIIKIMKPKHSTDIEGALKSMYNNNTSQLSDDMSEHMHVHSILLTDGCVTSGESLPNELCKLIKPQSTIHFIALGEDHDACLMNALGNSTPNTRNWFINKFEHTGNVYGEILFDGLHQVLDNVRLTVENGKIFNYKTGQMVDYIDIGNLASETNKNYHIISEMPDECNVIITSQPQGQNDIIVDCIATDLPPIIEIDEQLDASTHFVNLQFLRFNVQSIMAEIQNNNALYILNNISTSIYIDNVCDDSPAKLRRQCYSPTKLRRQIANQSDEPSMMDSPIQLHQHEINSLSPLSPLSPIIENGNDDPFFDLPTDVQIFNFPNEDETTMHDTNHILNRSFINNAENSTNIELEFPTLFNSLTMQQNEKTQRLNKIDELKKSYKRSISRIDELTIVLESYIIKYNITDGVDLLLLNGLLDDLIVIKHTLGSNQYLKYGVARQMSQGNQTTTNTITELPDINDNNNLSGVARSLSNMTSVNESPGRVDLMRSISQVI